jgi:16S rRNA (cytidine1402-2'-O)-methyltransferase
LVAVPIGNLEDITLRALRILRSVSLIACEDTRTTRQLLKLLDLPAPRLVACHEHNEKGRAVDLIERLSQGEDVALVSDAGTPSVSDPGYRVVTQVIEAGYAVSPIPGPCAAIAALAASGLPTDRFRFIGFLSAKGGARRAQLDELREARETLIFYESPH